MVEDSHFQLCPKRILNSLLLLNYILEDKGGVCYINKYIEMKNINKELFAFNTFPDEKWSFIPNIRRKYIVSTYGRVASLIGGNYKIRPLSTAGRGYLYVGLSSNGVAKSYCVHRLVAMTFISNPNNYPQVNHKDENKKNNHVSNLEWCTAKYNLDYSGVTSKWRSAGGRATAIIRKQNSTCPIQDKNVRQKLYRFKFRYLNSNLYSYTKDGKCLMFNDFSSFAKHFDVDVNYVIRISFYNYYLNSLEYNILGNYTTVIKMDNPLLK